MKKNRLIKVVLLIATIVVSSCGTKKHLVKEPTVVQPTTAPSGQVKPTDTKSMEEVRKQQFAQRVLDNAVYVDNITSKIDFTINSGSKKIEVSGKIQMRRDDVIRIQLSVPILGMEAGRLEFTKDYVMIVDRIHTEYVKGDYNKVDFLKNNGLDFYSLQALFWNQLFLPGEKTITKDKLKAFDITLNNDPKNSTLSLKRDRLSYVWQADNGSALIAVSRAVIPNCSAPTAISDRWA